MSVVWANPSQITETHAHTHTQGGRWEPCLTWLYTLTHITTGLGGGAAEQGGGGGRRRRRWQQWSEAEDCLAMYDGAHTYTHIHLCHSTTVLVSRHASSCRERKLTFHCLHNLDWPIERARDRERERGSNSVFVERLEEEHIYVTKIIC